METGRKVNILNADVFEFLPPSPDGAKTFDQTITSRQKLSCLVSLKLVQITFGKNQLIYFSL